jgi:5'-phosphate synthase pdxT subunit
MTPNDTMTQPVGLLALQGDFDKHRQALARLGRTTRLVRRPSELADCSHLIIPGGESTALARLIDRSGLREPLRAFAAAKPVMGTCAGLILLAARLHGEQPAEHGLRPLGLLDVTVLRNGYGRQIDSFTVKIAIDRLDGSREPLAAIFIRAPRIVAYGDGVEVLAEHGGEPVIVRQGRILAMAFHPELTEEVRIHRAFLSLGSDD